MNTVLTASKLSMLVLIHDVTVAVTNYIAPIDFPLTAWMKEPRM